MSCRPRAEDAEFYYTMGMYLDLDIAMRNATQETVCYLMETRGLSAAAAYSLASIGIDFLIAEVVDAVQLVYGAIPKRIFKTNPDYWHKR
jgi:acetamidase/formamidase